MLAFLTKTADLGVKGSLPLLATSQTLSHYQPHSMPVSFGITANPCQRYPSGLQTRWRSPCRDGRCLFYEDTGDLVNAHWLHEHRVPGHNYHIQKLEKLLLYFYLVVTD